MTSRAVIAVQVRFSCDLHPRSDDGIVAMRLSSFTVTIPVQSANLPSVSFMDIKRKDRSLSEARIDR